MPEAVIFDVDGTLVDTVDLHARAWQDVFREFGKEVPFEDVRRQIGKGADQLMPVFFPPAEVRRIGDKMLARRGAIYRERHLPLASPFPRVRELLERIRRDGSRIALASSARHDDFQANLDLLGIGDLVDAAVSSRDAARSKPFPDIFEAALAKLGGVAPAQAVAVGDTPYDAEAASRINLPAIGVLCGGFSEHELRAAGCTQIWNDPEDLLFHYSQTPLHRNGRE
jgi:HAD superfamily hydrolase (TIGR01509 family)